MTSTPVRSRSACPFLLSAVVAAAGLGACGTLPEVQESIGPVEIWPGTPDLTMSDVAFQVFSDNVARRASAETHALITSAGGYADYFGHAPPSAVDFRSEWVIFYAAGTKPSGGYQAGVQSIGVKGDSLYAITILQSPGLCPTIPTLTSPSVLVKFPAQKTHDVTFQHREAAATCGPPVTCEVAGCAPGFHCVALTISPPRVECVADQPATSPCAAILCGPGQQCVVLDSYPPKAQCEPIAKPVACVTSHECQDGLVCSTEQGVCNPDPACGPTTTCNPTCWGTCGKKAVPPAPRCTSSQECGAGQRCSTERGECLSCRAGNAPSLAACPSVCFGVCEPVLGPRCTRGQLDGNCGTADALKSQAAAACQAQGLWLNEFATGQACFASGFVDAKYSCCEAL